MVNKKGWIRIVEASIAIIIILFVLLSVSQIRERRFERDLSESINPLLEEIAKNTGMREKIIADSENSNEAENTIKAFLEERLRDPNIGYDVRICKIDEVCGLDKYPTGVSGNLYAGSRIISSTLSTMGTGPKKINLFLWIKG